MGSNCGDIADFMAIAARASGGVSAAQEIDAMTEYG
jgi:hypothetical protein